MLFDFQEQILQKGGAIVRPYDLPTSSEGERSSGTLPITDNPEMGIVLALEKGNDYQALAQRAARFQKATGLPVITQHEIVCVTVLIGYIIASPKTGGSPGMGEMLPVLAEIDDLCRKRNWKRVAVICEPDRFLEFKQQLEGLGLTVTQYCYCESESR